MASRRVRALRPWWSPTATLVIAASLLLCPATAALAVWSPGGHGPAGGAATVMPTGTAPSASAAGTAVTVGWSAATFPNGTAVAGYVVHRYSALNGGQAVVVGGCSGVVTTTTCTETPVPAGQWMYTVTPVQQTWTGGESPDSSVVTVG